ncbi:hypothetical protein C1645_767476, partial [Glomus cerebriforme]
MNNTNNKQENENYRIGINHKFHAQKYITIPKINVFKKSELPKMVSTTQNQLRPEVIPSSQPSITGNKRSCEFQITVTDNKSSMRQRQNDINKRLRTSKDSHEFSRNISSSSSSSYNKETSNREGTKKSRLVQKQSSSSQKKVILAASLSPYSSETIESSDNSSCQRQSQQNLDLSSAQHTIPRLPTARTRCSSNAKLKEKVTKISQHKGQPISQFSVQRPESPKQWNPSQTREQQLEVMKYWLDKYYKHNRFDPTISDLVSGKPWNEIEGKLLSQFMPIFKRYLSDNDVVTRGTEFYSLFFAALQDKHEIAVKNAQSKMLQDD